MDAVYEEIVALGWHPFLRINHQGHYCLKGSSSWQPLATVVTPNNQNWSGHITCFKSNPIDCTLLAQWDDGYADPWLILTDLNPVEADVRWYGFRSWIECEGRWGFPSLSNHAVECSYRDVKSDGFGWHKTRALTTSSSRTSLASNVRCDRGGCLLLVENRKFLMMNP